MEPSHDKRFTLLHANHRLAALLHWVYDASTQTLQATYKFGNDRIVVPVVDFSRNKVIMPVSDLYVNVTDKAKGTALGVCDVVAQNVKTHGACVTAYADEKFYLFNLLQRALEMSRGVDACVGGREGSLWCTILQKGHLGSNGQTYKLSRRVVSFFSAPMSPHIC